MSAVVKLDEPIYKARRHDTAVIAHLLARPFGGVFSDPGTGKTGEVLAAYHVLRKKRLIDRMLVVGPINPIYEAWPGEIAEWRFPYEMTILHGSKKNQLIDRDTDIYGLNYDGLVWFAEHAPRFLKRAKRWWLVVDESHNLKDTTTKRFRALRPLLPAFARRTDLTGTPRSQNLEDLFGQVYIVDLGEALGRYITQYRRSFFYPSGYGGYRWIPQQGAEDEIYRRLTGMFMRVDESVLDLPALHDVPRYVRLDDEARERYTTLEREFVLELEAGLITALNAGVKTGKLRQIANGFVYDDKGHAIDIHSSKVDDVVELVNELHGAPLLIGYEFTADAERIVKALGGAPVVGDYNPKKRRELFADFNGGKIPAMLAQTGSVSEGLNLQKACHHVALFGLPWKAKDYIQFRKRVHRAGQKRAVTVHHILARDTIDDKVMWPLIRRRYAEQQAFFNALKKVYGR